MSPSDTKSTDSEDSKPIAKSDPSGASGGNTEILLELEVMPEENGSAVELVVGQTATQMVTPSSDPTQVHEGGIDLAGGGDELILESPALSQDLALTGTTNLAQVPGLEIESSALSLGATQSTIAGDTHQEVKQVLVSEYSPAAAYEIPEVEAEVEEEDSFQPVPKPEQLFDLSQNSELFSDLPKKVEVVEKTSTTHTKIDLGDELLAEKTAMIRFAGFEKKSSETYAGSSSSEVLPSNESPTSEISVQNARLYLQEGFTEEAKKVLRQVLIKDTSDVTAQKLLEEIHHGELKLLFTHSETTLRKSYARRDSGMDESILAVDSQQVLKLLDDEFDIGFEKSLKEQKESAIYFDLDLPNGSIGQNEVGSKDRIDLAISFIEMELYIHAAQLLRTLIRADDEQASTAVSLLAYLHILTNEPYQTISVLQPFLNDVEIAIEDKVDFFYLLGRAHQMLGNKSEAIGWYVQVQQVEPGYRDSQTRLKQLTQNVPGPQNSSYPFNNHSGQSSGQSSSQTLNSTLSSSRRFNSPPK